MMLKPIMMMFTIMRMRMMVVILVIFLYSIQINLFNSLPVIPPPPPPPQKKTQNKTKQNNKQTYPDSIYNACVVFELFNISNVILFISVDELRLFFSNMRTRFGKLTKLNSGQATPASVTNTSTIHSVSWIRTSAECLAVNLLRYVKVVRYIC